jgi:hypothetical protein
MRKVISLCLYYRQDANDRFIEYILGLKYNHKARNLWFSDWEIWLYIDTSVKKEQILMDYIRSFNDPIITIKEIDNENNPMIERYRPIFDPTVDIVICRDIDSILSKTDAEYVSKFLEDDSKDVMCYHEYKMGYISMGGGVAVKTRNIVEPNNICIPIINNRLRDYDEKILEELINSVTTLRDRIVSYETRMLKNGVYCLIEDIKDDPDECEILWSKIGLPTYKNRQISGPKGILDMIYWISINPILYLEYLYSYQDTVKKFLIDGNNWFR